MFYSPTVLSQVRLIVLYNVLYSVCACMETLKGETVLMGEQRFLLKFFFFHTTMSRKNFKTRKSEYRLQLKIIIKQFKTS